MGVAPIVRGNLLEKLECEWCTAAVGDAKGIGRLTHPSLSLSCFPPVRHGQHWVRICPGTLRNSGAHTWLCRFVANSQVSKDEFKKVLSHMNSAVSYFGDDMLDDTKVNEIADQIYEECDHEHDGQLSYSGVFVACGGGGVSYAHIACIRPILRVHGSCCQAPPHRGVRCWPWRSRRKEGQG